MPSLRSKRLFAAVIFLASVVVLAVQLINPSPVMVTAGEDSTNVVEIGGYFQYRHVAVISVASCLLGITGSYLLLAVETGRPADGTADSGRDEPTTPAVSADGGDSVEPSTELLDARKEEWEETARRLSNKEAEVYEALLDADGVLPQSDLVTATDLSKASVSRALDSLEVKNLVERKRRGMGNVVLLL